MRERGPKIQQGVQRLNLKEEAEHRAFVESGKFDMLPKVETLNPGDRVVIRERAIIGIVHEMMGERVSIDFKERGTAARVTRNMNAVHRAEDYEKAVREQ